jgi:hypothetical protein
MLKLKLAQLEAAAASARVIHRCEEMKDTVVFNPPEHRPGARYTIDQAIGEETKVLRDLGIELIP